MSSSTRRGLVAFFVLAVLVGVIGRAVDPGTLADTLATFQWVWFLPAMLADLVVLLLRGRRAQVLLPRGVAYRDTMSVVGATFLAGMITPMRVGGLLRPWVLERRCGVPYGRGLAGIVAERLLDILALLVLFGLVGALGGDGAADVGEVGRVRVVMAVAAVGGLAAGGVVLALGGGGLERLAARVGGAGPFGQRLGHLAATFAGGLAAMAADRRRTAEAAAITVAMWAVGLMSGAAIMSGVPGLGATVARTLTFWAAVMAANATVPTPASLGAYEAAGMAALTLYGVAPAVGAVVALLAHLAALLVQAVFGAVCFVVDGGLPSREGPVPDGSASGMADGGGRD